MPREISKRENKLARLVDIYYIYANIIKDWSN